MYLPKLRPFIPSGEMDPQQMTTTKLRGATLKQKNEEINQLRNGTALEADPYGKNPHELGAKLDHGKLPVFRGAVGYFPRAIELVSAISAFGASKYAWEGWKTVPDGINRYSDALVRHLTAEGKGEFIDPDSGLPHAAHGAWNALARLELMLREKEAEPK